jgi:hypothetical protein
MMVSRLLTAVFAALLALPAVAENGVSEHKIIIGQSAAFSGPQRNWAYSCMQAQKPTSIT